MTANPLQQTFNCLNSSQSIGGRKQRLFTRNETTFKLSRKYFVYAKVLKLKATLGVKQVFLTLASKLHYAVATEPVANACGRGLWSKKIYNNEKRISFFGKVFGASKYHGNEK